MVLTVRDRFLLTLGIVQGINLTREAFKAVSQEFFDTEPMEIAVAMMRWNEEPENIIDLEKNFDKCKESPAFQDIDPQSTGSDTSIDNMGDSELQWSEKEKAELLEQAPASHEFNKIIQS